MVSLGGRDRSRLLATGTIGSHRVVLADAEDAPDHVIADTFLRFKGLKGMYVIIS